MKTLKLLFLFTLLISASCKNDDDTPTSPIDQLPPATQIGAQTFGCLINGEAFIPDVFGSGAPKAFYQFVDGAYTFVISSSSGGGTSFVGIGIGGIDVQQLNETTYNLIEESSGNTFGKMVKVLDAYTTSVNNPGLLNITNFDDVNGIISGTFEFTVLDNEGKEIKITDGRFDMLYTN